MRRTDRGHRPPKGSSGRPRFWGRHAVGAALANPKRRAVKLWATRDAAARMELSSSLPVTFADVADLGRLVPQDAPHQGLVVEVDPLDDVFLDELLGQEGTRPLLVLDQVTDPHNVGAILRSAAAFGVKAIVTTARHSPEVTGVLAKSASGALEFVPFVTVQNLARALNELKDRGFMTVGLDSEGSEDLGAVALQAPLALVLGAEGKGLRQLTRETCSVVARLDMPGQIKSLNVSNAAVLALYIGASRLGLMK